MVNSMRVKIITGGEKPSIMIIDDENQYQRKWFEKHVWWAMRTNHTITLEPTKDGVTFVDRRKEFANVR